MSPLNIGWRRLQVGQQRPLEDILLTAGVEQNAEVRGQ